MKQINPIVIMLQESKQNYRTKLQDLYFCLRTLNCRLTDYLYYQSKDDYANYNSHYKADFAENY